VYSPDFTAPKVANARKAITVHDLAWQLAPQHAPAGLRRFLDRVVPRQMDESEVIFTVSAATRNDLISYAGVAESRVVLAPNGVDEPFFERNPEGPPSPLFPGRDYLLMVGTIEPRKNHLNVLRSLGIMRNAPLLVIAGNVGWGYRETLTEIKNAARVNRVLWLGYVADADLIKLYAGASAVVCASWYEGFDLPVIESLAAGRPLALSDIPVHREVAGPLADYFDPSSPESIAHAIESALSCHEDIERRQKRARQFSWDESAAIVWKTLSDLHGRSRL
jgi:glycosyltransferase involved in cell wall biosynthesis